MKISNQIVETPNHFTIIRADYLTGYIIEIIFSNDKKVKIDFESFLKKSHHEDIRKYLNKKLFQTFQIINGNLNWNDYDLIFPLEDLYSGKLENKPVMEQITVF